MKLRMICTIASSNGSQCTSQFFSCMILLAVQSRKHFGPDRRNNRRQAGAQDTRAEEQQQPGRRSVLLVGNPALPLKGFDVALAVLAMVNRVLPLDVTWICQTHPTPSMVSGLATCGLRINLHVSPSQVCDHVWTLRAVNSVANVLTQPCMWSRVM